MAPWSMSFEEPETRTASPWIWDFSFGNLSRTSLVIVFPSSWSMPWRSFPLWPTVPFAAGSVVYPPVADDVPPKPDVPSACV